MPNNKRRKRGHELDTFFDKEKVRGLEDQLNGEPQTIKAKIRKIVGKSLSKIQFRKENQKKYYKLLKENEITICSGAAGTGKSYVAVYTALELLINPDTPYEKIYIITPAVEAEEKLGYLPGNVKEKLSEYIASTLHIFNKLLGKVIVEKLIQEEYIDIQGLGYIRGMTIDDSIVVCEEFQNTTIKQMKTCLTRIGENAKFFISGDVKQNDRHRKIEDSGLHFAMTKVIDIDGITNFEFQNSDIVRNPIIGKILERFEAENK